MGDFASTHHVPVSTTTTSAESAPLIIPASFYDTLGSLTPDLDTGSAEVRAEFQPLNPPPDGSSPAAVEAATATASTNAFRLAMFVTAALAALGAVINAAGLQRKPGTSETGDAPEGHSSEGDPEAGAGPGLS